VERNTTQALRKRRINRPASWKYASVQCCLVGTQLQKAGQYSSVKLHRSVTIDEEGIIEFENMKDLKPKLIAGF
jgi:hypothetical protein